MSQLQEFFGDGRARSGVSIEEQKSLGFQGAKVELFCSCACDSDEEAIEAVARVLFSKARPLAQELLGVVWEDMVQHVEEHMEFEKGRRK